MFFSQIISECDKTSKIKVDEEIRKISLNISIADHLIGILSGSVSLWLTLILMIELHRKNLHDPRGQVLRLRRLPMGIGNPSGAVITATTNPPENNASQLHEETCQHCNLMPSESMPQKLCQVDERGSWF